MRDFHTPSFPFCLVAVGVFFAPAACFAFSTDDFHFLTISLARFATSTDGCERCFPTAKPAFVSYTFVSCKTHRTWQARTRRIGSVTFWRFLSMARISRIFYQRKKKSNLTGSTWKDVKNAHCRGGCTLELFHEFSQLNRIC